MGRPLNLSKFGDRSNLELHNQIEVTAFVNGSAQTAYLKQQKNKNTFHVVDTATGTFTAVCKFANVAVPAAGQMVLVATKNDTTTFNVSRVTNRFVSDFGTPAVKYLWGFAPAADGAYQHVSLLGVPTPASPNLAP